MRSRGMAQFGSASALGAEGRGFKSRYPDECDVSGHRGHLNPRFVGSGVFSLVAAVGVEGGPIGQNVLL